VGLVDDDKIPVGGRENISQGLAPSGHERSQHDGAACLRALSPFPAAPRGDDGRQRELALELLAPLPDETRWCEHEDVSCEATLAKLAQHDAGLDRLTEADLVGEDGPATHLPENDRGRPQLEVKWLEAQLGEPGKGVETRPVPHPDRRLHERRPLARHRGLALELA
jgi:hypothetical protein